MSETAGAAWNAPRQKALYADAFKQLPPLRYLLEDEQQGFA